MATISNDWWKNPEMGLLDTGSGVVQEWCAAARMWRAACTAAGAPERATATWDKLVEVSPPDSKWHSLRNCVAYQAGIWQNLLAKSITDASQPTAFKFAIVLRHTPTSSIVKLLTEVLRDNPDAQELSTYVVALLNDDEATWCGQCGAGKRSKPIPEGGEPTDPPPLVPLRDRRLFGDCELAVLSASREEYDAHAKLVRAEYASLTHQNYIELRVKILDQLYEIPKLYHTPEFECFEATARENLDREVNTLRDHLESESDTHSESNKENWEFFSVNEQ